MFLAVPRHRCPQSNHTIVSSYRNKCVVLYEHSVTFGEAYAICSSRNSSMLNPTTNGPELLSYITWWMTQMDVYGYVWLSRENGDSTGSGRVFGKSECLELFRNTSFNDVWQQRITSCQYKDNFICVSGRFDFKIVLFFLYCLFITIELKLEVTQLGSFREYRYFSCNKK